MAGIDKGTGLEQQQSGENNTLDNYLSSELKLQEKIDKKLQDPNLRELARKELEEIKTRFQENLRNVNN